MNNNNKLKRRYWMIGGFSLLAATIALVAMSFGTPEGAAALTPGNETTTVFVGDLSETASANGYVTAANEADLSVARSGEVVDVYVGVGDFIKVGEPLAQLETTALE